jgi:homopolymeric O-antigen transport system ATP-binding protein
MAQIALSVENLSKSYTISHEGRDRSRYKTLREDLVAMPKRLWSRLSRNGQSSPETFWALKDISFEIKQGEVVGIIGRNGAGKSTLLKILSRITEPTSGEGKIYGRIGSLLEVGTGFHPELTGRENIFLNGAILGMSRAEIRARFDEIVAFAEVEKFLDTPVKRYSSGMYVRLAFAVAAHLNPEILLVDEVLAVGDAGFQKKCLGKMKDISKGGKTVLFVSHNMAAISTLCETAIWLSQGKVNSVGPAPAQIASYASQFISRSADKMVDVASGPIEITEVSLRAPNGELRTNFDQFEPITIHIDVECKTARPQLRFVVRVRPTKNDIVILETTDWDFGDGLGKNRTGNYAVECHLPGNLLSIGTYMLSVGIDEPRGPVYILLENAISFVVTAAVHAGELSERNTIISPHQKWLLAPSSRQLG